MPNKGLYLIFLFILSSNLLMAQSEWVLYTSDIDGTFSVESPEPLISKTTEANTSVGDIVTHIYALEGNEDDLNKLYLINQIDYPSGSFPVDSTDLMHFYMESAIENTLLSIEGELVYSNEINNLGDAAKLFRIRYNNGQAIVKGKCLIHADRFYMLTVYSHKDDSLNGDMDYFLNSFELRAY